MGGKTTGVPSPSGVQGRPPLGGLVPGGRSPTETEEF